MAGRRRFVCLPRAATPTTNHGELIVFGSLAMRRNVKDDPNGCELWALGSSKSSKCSGEESGGGENESAAHCARLLRDSCAVAGRHRSLLASLAPRAAATALPLWAAAPFCDSPPQSSEVNLQVAPKALDGAEGSCVRPASADTTPGRNNNSPLAQPAAHF